MNEKFSIEVYRYLGYDKAFVLSDEKLNVLIEENFRWLKENAQVKKVHRIFKVKYLDGQIIFGENMSIESEDLRRWLIPCQKVFIGALTLGLEVDKYLYRLSIIDAYKHLVMDACCTAYVEYMCDEMEKALAQHYGVSLMTNRFSPGYGDLKLATQKDILKSLDAMRQIGLSINTSYMMMPQKSVSFVIGFGEEIGEINDQNQGLKIQREAFRIENIKRKCDIGGACHYCSHPCQYKNGNV